MKLVDQVCSLELAERLKNLGIKQESLFYWLMHDGIGEPECSGNIHIGDADEKDYFIELASAFTVAELGEMLPGGICQTDKINKKRDSDLKSYCIYLAGDSFHAKDDNEANARAKMLIYLIENGLVEDKKTFIPDNAFDLVMESK
jgi:hypothetical protein